MVQYVGGDYTSPASKLVLITPADSPLATVPTRGVWVGGAGNIAVIAAQDSAAVTISGVPAGTLLPIAVSQINSTNTTATLIVAMY